MIYVESIGDFEKKGKYKNQDKLLEDYCEYLHSICSKHKDNSSALDEIMEQVINDNHILNNNGLMTEIVLDYETNYILEHLNECEEDEEEYEDCDYEIEDSNDYEDYEDYEDYDY